MDQTAPTDATTGRPTARTEDEQNQSGTQLPLRSVVRDLPGYVPGRRAVGADVAALASNESPFEALPSVHAEILAATARVHRYPDAGGLALRSAIAERFAPGTGVDEVVIGAGSVGVLQQLLSAVLEPGDEVVYAWRSFEAYPILITVVGGSPVPVPLDQQDRHDLPAMLAAIGPRTRAVILCSPNNPTGTTISHTELTDFLDAVPADVMVVLDEAYIDFVTDADAASSLNAYRDYPNLAVLRTFSKAHGLAGLRIGYAVARPALAEGARRTGMPFSVSDLAQQAALASLKAQRELAERVAATVEERARLTAGLRDLGWPVPDSQGNFVWLRMDDEAAAALVSSLTEAGILVRAYPRAGVRITIGRADDTDRVLRVLSSHPLPEQQPSQSRTGAGA